MKAKNMVRRSKDFQEALQEVQKEDDVRALYVKVPFSLFMKLHLEVKKRRMSMAAWIRQRIEEIK